MFAFECQFLQKFMLHFKESDIIDASFYVRYKKRKAYANFQKIFLLLTK